MGNIGQLVLIDTPSHREGPEDVVPEDVTAAGAEEAQQGTLKDWCGFEPPQYLLVPSLTRANPVGSVLVHIHAPSFRASNTAGVIAPHSH